MTQCVMIVGAGGHGRDTLDVFSACNAAVPGSWNVLGFLSEMAADHGREYDGVRVLGGLELLANERDVRVVCAVGDPTLRRRLVQRCRQLGATFATVVHPRAVIAPNCEVGEGVMISAGALVTGSARLGDHVLLNLGCTVAHDVVVEDFVTLAPGVHVSGHALLRSGCDLGTGAVVLPKVEVGARAIVGAGAVVTKSLPADCTAVGVPARVIAQRAANG